MINGETNFQQSFHLLFNCFPVMAQRSFENLQEEVTIFFYLDPAFMETPNSLNKL